MMVGQKQCVVGLRKKEGRSVVGHREGTTGGFIVCPHATKQAYGRYLPDGVGGDDASAAIARPGRAGMFPACAADRTVGTLLRWPVVRSLTARER